MITMRSQIEDDSSSSPCALPPQSSSRTHGWGPTLTHSTATLPHPPTPTHHQLNKVDLVTPAAKARVLARLRAINAAARVVECAHADAPLDAILEQRAFDLERILAAEPGFLEVEAAQAAKDEDKAHGHRHHHGPGHDHGDHSGCDHGHDREHAHGEREHAHSHEHAEGADDCAACASGDPRHDHGNRAHRHDARVSSVGVRLDGDVDLPKLNAWLSQLVEKKGADIYRSKGILAGAGRAEKLAFHGVHMMISFGQGLGREWGKDEKRACKAIFIGKDLDRKELEEGFRSCAAAPAAAP
jgi:G3E family GTPase